MHEPRGTRICVQTGEVLQKGNFYRDNLRGAKSEYVYISDGKPHVLSPKFTYYGYRYAKVTGVHHLTLDSFVGVAYYSDVRPVSTMVTGDEKLNQLLSIFAGGRRAILWMCRRTAHSGMSVWAGRETRRFLQRRRAI